MPARPFTYGKRGHRPGHSGCSYIAPLGGEAGTDYLTFVAEDLCQLGVNFADVLNTEVGSGKVAFLGGTPGNPLSEAWQSCEEPELAPELGSSEPPTPAGLKKERCRPCQASRRTSRSRRISYEYADGFLGGIRAYEAAGVPLDLVLTLRTDEVGLFCEWAAIANPDFKIYFSSGGGFDSRIALTAGMMALNGESVPPNIVVPAQMRQVTETDCNAAIPGAARHRRSYPRTSCRRCTADRHRITHGRTPPRIARGGVRRGSSQRGGNIVSVASGGDLVDPGSLRPD